MANLNAFELMCLAEEINVDFDQLHTFTKLQAYAIRIARVYHPQSEPLNLKGLKKTAITLGIPEQDFLPWFEQQVRLHSHMLSVMNQTM